MKPYIICDRCGRIFTPGNRPDGIHNGVIFTTQSGEIQTYCTDCLIKIGTEHRNNRNDQKGRR